MQELLGDICDFHTQLQLGLSQFIREEEIFLMKLVITDNWCASFLESDSISQLKKKGFHIYH